VRVSVVLFAEKMTVLLLPASVTASLLPLTLEGTIAGAQSGVSATRTGVGKVTINVDPSQGMPGRYAQLQERFLLQSIPTKRDNPPTHILA
jgi:hypothetical protein